jgi:hypothetical protein
MVAPYTDQEIVQVRKKPSWPRSWANFSLYCCIPTGMHGPTCIFWANLTPFSLQPPYIIHLAKQAIKERALEVDTFSHVTSKPHSPRQHWHRDAGALFDGVGDLGSHQLPPHGVVTFVPLIDVSEELGPTEYLLKSHIPCPPNEKVDIITPHETNSIHEGIRVTLDE